MSKHLRHSPSISGWKPARRGLGLSVHMAAIKLMARQSRTSIRRRRSVSRIFTVTLSVVIMFLIYRSSTIASPEMNFTNSSVSTPEMRSRWIEGINSTLGRDEFSADQLDLTRSSCLEPMTGNVNKTVRNRVILWTTPLPPSAHKRLYHNLKPTRVEIERTDFECWTYTNIPRIAQNTPAVLQPNQIFFGLATSKDRLMVPDAISSYWLQGSDTNLYVSIPKSDAHDAEKALKRHYKKMGLNSFNIVRSSYEQDQTYQYARLSATMYELCKDKSYQHVKWFVHLDDDTLMTSVSDYARMLDKYDHTKPLYVGVHSEASSALWHDGRGAWGGASIAISRPLAQQISERWQECLPRMLHTNYGDHKLDACVAYIQGRPPRQPDLTLEYSLHQIDFYGSIDGLLRTGMKWLTMHHFGWMNLFPYANDEVGTTDAKIKKVVKSMRLLGADNLFSNYLLRHDENGATILTNGYAVTQYLVPMTAIELEQIEKTYRQQNNGDYEASVGPSRPPKEEGKEKKTYYVHDVVERRDKAGKREGINFTYRYDRGGVVEDIVVDWME